MFGLNPISSSAISALIEREFPVLISDGGGSGNAKIKLKGWANERAAYEASLHPKKIQTILRQTGNKQAKRIAKIIYNYDIGNIDLDILKEENKILKSRLRIKEEYTKELEIAQEIMAAFIEDEQDAIDVLMTDFKITISLVLQQH